MTYTSLQLLKYLIEIQFFPFAGVNQFLLREYKRSGLHYVSCIPPNHDLKKAHRDLNAFKLLIVVVEYRTIVNADPAGLTGFFFHSFFEYIIFNMTPVAFIAEPVA